MLFGQFITDPLQKVFSKLSLGSDGTYFVNVQQCIEKLLIKQTLFFSSQYVNSNVFDVKTGNQGTSCDDKYCEECLVIFDNLENFKSFLSDHLKWLCLVPCSHSFWCLWFLAEPENVYYIIFW